MVVIVSKKDGIDYSYSGVKNTYVQNGVLLVIEFYQNTSEEKRINVKHPLADVVDILSSSDDHDEVAGLID